MELKIDATVERKIDNLYRDAQERRGRWPSFSVKTVTSGFQPEDFKNHYLAISKAQGEHIHGLIVREKLKSIVEFGTSFGISTLFLAAAVRETDGRVIATELLEEKAKVAQANFEDAAVADVIDLRIGDALETLSKDVGAIDFLLLDGWKDLYLPLLMQLEEQLNLGAYVYVDNADMKGVRPTLEHIRTSSSYRAEVLHRGKAVLAKKMR